MKKKLFIGLTLFLLQVMAFAQSKMVITDYNKTMQPGIQTEVPFPERTVENAIEDKMQKLGYKGKDTKGYTLYKGVRLTELGPDFLDIYIRSEKKSRKEKDISIVTMLVSSGFEKFYSDSSKPELMNNARAFLNSFTDVASAYDLEQQIIAQETITVKAGKKYTNLVDDGNDLQRKKTKIETQIQENTKAQADQKSEEEKQRQILDNLKAKRKKS